jgi:hypothetical protein
VARSNEDGIESLDCMNSGQRLDLQHYYCKRTIILFAVKYPELFHLGIVMAFK